MTGVDLTEPVAAAARAWFDRLQEGRRDSGRFRPDGQLWQWEDLTAMDQHAFREFVLPIVTAAAPLVGAQVRSQAHAAIEAERLHRKGGDPRAQIEDLYARGVLYGMSRAAHLVRGEP